MPNEEKLKLLSIFHYIVGGLGVLFSLFPLIHLSAGIHLLSLGSQIAPSTEEIPADFLPMFKTIPYIFIIMGGGFFLFGQVMSWFCIYSGKQIKKRQHYKLSFIVACIICAFVPLGTCLGIFSLFVLSNPDVKKLYGIYPSLARL